MASSWTRRLIGGVIACAAFLIYTPAFAQTGGLTGKCMGEDGKPMAGYVVQIERVGIKWKEHTKTNKKGEYIYIGLSPDDYKVTLIGTDGNPIQWQQKHVGIGDPTELNFDIKQAKQEAQQAAAANPEYQKQVAEQKQSANLKQLFDQGRALYAAQNYTGAADLFEKALPLAKDKNAAIVMSQLADTWGKAASVETNPDTRKQDQQKSLDYFNKVLAIAPNDAATHNNLGHLYADMGRSADAESEFKKAAELDPTHASSYYYNLGAILVNKGDMNGASDALKKATDLDPNNSNAWYWYGMALMGKATIKPDGTMVPAPGTIEAFQTYLKIAPNGPMAPQAQASLDTLEGKQNLEYKKKK